MSVILVSTFVSLPRELARLCSPSTLLGVYRRFDRQNGTEIAASLAYYVLFSLFPALLVIGAAADLVWSPEAFFETAEPLLESLPPDAQQTLRAFIADAMRGSGGRFLSAGALGMLWAGSGWFRALTRAIENIYGVESPRGFFHNAGFALRLLVMSVFGALGLMATLIGPGLLRPIVDLGVLDGVILATWAWIRWPILLILLTLSTSLLYSSASRLRGRGRFLSAGGVVAVTAWVLMTLGLQLYFQYAATTSWMYGTLSGVIALLLWAWLFNMAALAGAAVNAELLRCPSGPVASAKD